MVTLIVEKNRIVELDELLMMSRQELKQSGDGDMNIFKTVRQTMLNKKKMIQEINWISILLNITHDFFFLFCFC